MISSRSFTKSKMCPFHYIGYRCLKMNVSIFFISGFKSGWKMNYVRHCASWHQMTLVIFSSVESWTISAGSRVDRWTKTGQDRTGPGPVIVCLSEPWVPWQPQVWADQLALSQPGGRLLQLAPRIFRTSYGFASRCRRHTGHT